MVRGKMIREMVKTEMAKEMVKAEMVKEMDKTRMAKETVKTDKFTHLLLMIWPIFCHITAFYNAIPAAEASSIRNKPADTGQHTTPRITLQQSRRPNKQAISNSRNPLVACPFSEFFD